MQARQPTLEGRWALVTGAGKRIGATIARALHEAGASVAVHYFTSAHDADRVVAELNAERPGSALAVGGDIRDIAVIERIVAEVTAHAGRLDVLVNNASTFYPTPLGTVTDDAWHDLIDSNLKAPLFFAQAALPHLKQAHGVIINIVDIHAQRPLRHHVVYGAAKAGLAMLTRSLAKDLGPEIRVNGVAPGAILWPEGGIPESVQQTILKQVPLKRTGAP